METKTKPKIQIARNMGRSPSWNSESPTQLDSPYSRLRFHSPLRSDQGDPPETPPFVSPTNSPENPQPVSSPHPVGNSKDIVAVDNLTRFSPLTSPAPPAGKAENVAAVAAAAAAPAPNSNLEVVVSRTVREDGMPAAVRKVGPEGASGTVTSRSKREEMVKIGELGFRISEVALCLISFSVMAADKTRGWSGDSFDRYKEYRYCLCVNVIAFVYSGFQAYDLCYHLVARKHVIRCHLRRHFNFFMDQALAYLLLSASSSAATQVDDWQSNWGKDEFTEMATASIAMAFLAFISFAGTSLIAGYNLCKHD